VVVFVDFVGGGCERGVLRSAAEPAAAAPDGLSTEITVPTAGGASCGSVPGTGRTFPVRDPERAVMDHFRLDEHGLLAAGAQFDGPRERINYVPMLEEINNARSQFIDPLTRENFGTVENRLADYIAKNPDAVVDFKVRPVFEGSSKVPVKIEVQYRIDSGKWVIKEFDNVR
jgi:hypothetical protein